MRDTTGWAARLPKLGERRTQLPPASLSWPRTGLVKRATRQEYRRAPSARPCAPHTARTCMRGGALGGRFPCVCVFPPQDTARVPGVRGGRTALHASRRSGWAPRCGKSLCSRRIRPGLETQTGPALRGSTGAGAVPVPGNAQRPRSLSALHQPQDYTGVPLAAVQL